MGGGELSQDQQQHSTWASNAKLAAYEYVGYYVGNNKQFGSILAHVEKGRGRWILIHGVFQVPLSISNSNDTPSLATEVSKTWPISPPIYPLTMVSYVRRVQLAEGSGDTARNLSRADCYNER